MPHDTLTALSMQRLRRALAAQWSVLWIFGLLALAALAALLGSRLRSSGLDADLALRATATYGLTWFDDSGDFHSELWSAEPELADSAVDTWVIAPTGDPGEPLEFLLAPEDPRFTGLALEPIVKEVMATGEDSFRSGADGRDKPYRLHSMPTFLDDRHDRPYAAIVTVASSAPARREQVRFLQQLALAVVLLGAVGVTLGLRLAKKAVRPVAKALSQREQFLLATAHELRSPIASLLAVCESGTAGDEAAS
ncbi:MAG: hypothetical protein AAGG01_23750, partial [Planctomycetota bacterium]